jgi:hypothetical protein
LFRPFLSIDRPRSLSTMSAKNEQQSSPQSGGIGRLFSRALASFGLDVGAFVPGARGGERKADDGHTMQDYGKQAMDEGKKHLPANLDQIRQDMRTGSVRQVPSLCCCGWL